MDAEKGESGKKEPGARARPDGREKGLRGLRGNEEEKQGDRGRFI